MICIGTSVFPVRAFVSVSIRPVPDHFSVYQYVFHAHLSGFVDTLRKQLFAFHFVSVFAIMQRNLSHFTAVQSNGALNCIASRH